ncbi:glycosyltransferase family 4 protein [Phaeodactylibacter xiamenensis]|uniref:glycosyltransferase family 4 protein n=1 Tax=Phaeodactylibacter xiamenensis TaxID=1524460 RepID=UPI003CCBAD5D
MKIILISPFQLSLNRGIERFSYSLANELAHQGNKVIVYTWRSKSNVNWGAWHKDIKLRQVPRFKYYIRLFAPLYYRKWLKKDAPDVILLNFLYHGEQKLPPFYRYLYVLNSPASQVPHRYDFIKKHLQSFPNMSFVAVSKMVAREAKSYINNRKIKVIPNGVDTTKFIPVTVNRTEEPIKLVTASAFEERKGIQYIIKAIAQYPSLDIIYDIYGAGDYELQLKKIIKEHNLDKKVKINSPVNNIEIILPLYDVFCLPSKGEAFALAPIEALSCGVPILVSKHPPYDELVKGDYGICVDEHSPNDIIKAIRDLIKVKRTAPETIRSAAIPYDWKNIAKQYLEAIES